MSNIPKSFRLDRHDKAVLKGMLYVFTVTQKKRLSWESDYLYRLNLERVSDAERLIKVLCGD